LTGGIEITLLTDAIAGKRGQDTIFSDHLGGSFL
jgi:hypothetical protein